MRHSFKYFFYCTLNEQFRTKTHVEGNRARKRGFTVALISVKAFSMFSRYPLFSVADA